LDCAAAQGTPAPAQSTPANPRIAANRMYMNEKQACTVEWHRAGLTPPEQPNH